MVESFVIDKTTASDRNAIVRMHNKGEFWKPCPGTTQGYLCCGYQILTPSTGCGMYCKYCILQAYFPHQCQVEYDNFNDLETEVRKKMEHQKDVIRFGTGEFGDSLYSEHITGVAGKTAALLEEYPNVIVEFKTKSINIEPILSIRKPQKVIIGFSLNTETMIQVMERDTASLEQRFLTAKRCVEAGFYVAFHFDPMFIYNNWENEYRSVVRSIFKYIKDPEKIAWISMGGFRTMPALKTILKEKKQHLDIFSGELITGADGKLRYFRPLRVAMYKAMQEEFERHYPEITLYLCMESPEIWQESGMKKRIPSGLVNYLDRRAEVMLNI